VADPQAPIAAVARHAGVGMAALYRRYPSKDHLLRKLCGDGLDRYVIEVEAALDDDADPWSAFAGFVTRIVDADVHSLTQRLAGTFAPTEDLWTQAQRAQELTARFFARIRAAGVIRPDVAITDVDVLLDQVAAVRFGDEERTRSLRRRYLTLMLDAVRHPPSDTPLPGSSPTWDELGQRWAPHRPA
jgi:AcrR family transcriptional regulator